MANASHSKRRTPRLAKVRHVAGKMNGLEQRYANYLTALGVDWKYEPFKLRLAENTTYSPDFCYQEDDGTLTVVETKGYWRDDAIAKTKIAAAQFPWFRFMAVQWEGGAWKIQRFPPYDA